MPVFRFHGQFVSESRYNQLSHLRGASRYLSEAPTRAEIRQTEARSEAARRGWETRRAGEEKRREAARRGWETRRERVRAEETKRAFPFLPERFVTPPPLPAPALPPEPEISYDAGALREKLTEIAGKVEDQEGAVPERVTEQFAEDIETIDDKIRAFEDTGDEEAYKESSRLIDDLSIAVSEAEEIDFTWDYDETTEEFIYDNMLDDILDIEDDTADSGPGLQYAA